MGRTHFLMYFLLANGDLMQGETARIGVVEDGINRTVLFLDARPMKDGGNEFDFVWRLVKTVRGEQGRSLEECFVGKAKLGALTWRFNHSGVMCPEAQEADPLTLFEQVFNLTENPQIKCAIEKLRQRRKRVREKFAEFALIAATEAVHKPYTQQDVDSGFTSELDKMRIFIQKTYFVPESGEPKKSEIVWDDAVKEKFSKDMQLLRERIRQESSR